MNRINFVSSVSFLAFVLAGCGAKTPAPESGQQESTESQPAADAAPAQVAPATDAQVPPAADETDAKCVEECVQRNQARATAAEIIEADCRKECSRAE